MKPFLFPRVLVLGLLCIAQALQAAAFIKFDGVDGESTEASHAKWSDLQSFSQSISRSIDPTSGSTRPRGVAVFGDIVCVKDLDKSSPKLAEAIARGMVFPKVEIHLTRSLSDGRQTTYYQYELTNVLISSYSVSGTGQADEPPVESISLNFERVNVIYTEYDSTGASKGNVEYSWNIEQGEA